MFRKSLLISTCFVSLIASPLSLEDVVQQFLEKNYDLQLARQEIDKVKSDLITAKQRPNPVISGMYQYLDPSNRLSDVSAAAAGMAGIHLDHPIEMGGKRNRRIENAEASITYANLFYNETVRQQLLTLIANFYQIKSDEAMLKNARENHQNYKDFLVIAKAKYDHGFLSELDYQKLQLQEMYYSQEEQIEKTNLKHDTETLSVLISVPASQIVLTQIQDFNLKTIPALDQLIEYAKNNRSDCLAAKENINVADSAYTLEKANAVPDITAGIESEAFGPQYHKLIGFTFSLPLPVYDKNEGMIERSRIGKLQAATFYSKTLQQAESDVRQSYDDLKAKMRIYSDFQKGFLSAKEIKEKQEKVFALKAMSIIELLEAQKNFREFQMLMTQSLIDAQMAETILVLNSGYSLDKKLTM